MAWLAHRCCGLRCAALRCAALCWLVEPPLLLSMQATHPCWQHTPVRVVAVGGDEHMCCVLRQPSAPVDPPACSGP